MTPSPRRKVPSHLVRALQEDLLALWCFDTTQPLAKKVLGKLVADLNAKIEEMHEISPVKVDEVGT